MPNRSKFRNIADMSETPSKNSLNLTQASPPLVIGMIHVPSASLLTGEPQWRDLLSLPEVLAEDWARIGQLEALFREIAQTLPSHLFAEDFPGVIALSDRLASLFEIVSQFSFINYLYDRAFQEIEGYQRNGVRAIQLENIGAPYFVRQGIPKTEALILAYIASMVRAAYPDLPMGVQMLAFGDPVALEIALRFEGFYIRGESFLFQGVRPEGATPNQGNLAQAYLMRNYFTARLGRDKTYPRIYVDVQKKHTRFGAELANLGAWLENIEFQKLEGVIVTGPATGQAAKETDLQLVKARLEGLEARTRQWGQAISVPLIIGSGANPANIRIYRKYANAIIVGSAVKKGGYWENPLEEARLLDLMEAFEKND